MIRTRGYALLVNRYLPHYWRFMIIFINRLFRGIVINDPEINARKPAIFNEFVQNVSSLPPANRNERNFSISYIFKVNKVIGAGSFARDPMMTHLTCVDHEGKVGEFWITKKQLKNHQLRKRVTEFFVEKFGCRAIDIMKIEKDSITYRNIDRTQQEANDMFMESAEHKVLLCQQTLPRLKNLYISSRHHTSCNFL